MTWKSKNIVFACVVGFVGGQEMGGAASLELSVIVIIYSLISFFLRLRMRGRT